MYTVYILHSKKHGRYYIGVTSNLKERLKRHNRGWSKATKPFAPWKIIYTEEYTDKHEAYKREYYLKSPSGYLEAKRIKSDNV